MTTSPTLGRAELDAVLAALPIALAVFGPDHRLRLSTESMTHWYGLEPGMAPPGLPFADLVRMLAWNGAFGSGEPAELAAAVLAIDRSRGCTRMIRTRSGRCLQTESRPLPDGGFITCSVDVTGLWRSEAEASGRARLFETVLSRLHGGVALFDAELRLGLSNTAYETLIGLPGGSIRPGMTYAEVTDRLVERGELAADDRDASIARIEDMRHRETVRQRERRNGEVLSFGVQPMPDGGCLVEVNDVTALKRAEDEARTRAALLDGVLEALPHGISVYGPDRRVTRYNAAYAEMMDGAMVRIGDSLEEIVARRVASGELLPADAEVMLHRHRVLDPLAAGTLRRVRPSGKVLESRVARLPDGGHVAVLTDVTALHQAETESRRRAAILEAMLGAVRQGIILYGPDRRVVTFNQRTCILANIPPESLTGRLLEELVDAQVARGELTAEQAGWYKTLDRSRPQRYSRTRPDGTVLDIACDPIAGGGFVITYTDVTEDRHIRAELERARQAAEAASETKSRFLATMSHELRTPLNAVIGFSEALAHERDRARITEYAKAINDAGAHLLLLIDDILDVARSQTDALHLADAPVPLGPLLAGAARAVATAAEQAGVKLEITMPPGLPALLGDARRLHQVLLNLLGNAVKFTPMDGHITLSAEVGPEGLAIRIADTGIGIAPADRERVFEPFTQVDNSLARRFHGSGLGLYIARTLAQALGGTVTLEDPPAQAAGTVAVLRFPATRLFAPI